MPDPDDQNNQKAPETNPGDKTSEAENRPAEASESTKKEETKKGPNPDDLFSDKPGPIKEPLTETEARVFVREEVRRYLFTWTQVIAGIVGVSSLIALVGLYASVEGTVKEEARKDANEVAHQTIDPMTNTVTQTFTKSLKDYIDAYTDLEKRRANVDKSVTEGEASLKALKDKISGEQDNITKLDQSITAGAGTLGIITGREKQLSSEIDELQRIADNLEKLKNTDTNKLADVVRELNSGGADLLEKVEQILSELRQTYNYGIRQVSSNSLEDFFSNTLSSTKQQSDLSSVDQLSQDRLNSSGSRTLADKAKTLEEIMGLLQSDEKGLEGYRERDVQFPEGAEPIGSWSEPTDSGKRARYVVVQDPTDKSKWRILFGPGPQGANITVFILYRVPVHAVVSK